MTDITVIEALSSKKLFGHLPEFKKLESWASWIVWLKALFALPMTEPELETYRQCTKRQRPPAKEPTESATIVGRRGGKSKMAALVGAFIAAFVDFTAYLSTGERPMVLILARDKEQARVVYGYFTGILKKVPALRAMIASESGDEVTLTNGVVIAIKTSDYRTVRGVTVVCCICDEVAFWNFDSDSANPDVEVIRSLRPAMATIPTAKLILISTGYAMAGVLYCVFR
jgi:phage terminase large subunit-like protein